MGLFPFSFNNAIYECLSFLSALDMSTGRHINRKGKGNDNGKS